MNAKTETLLKGTGRFFKALVQWPFTPSRIAKPRLIMTLLVKNEEEKLEQNLLFHHAMGVDGFILTDNNSTDGTMDIVRRYQEKGWILDVIEEHSTGYEQKRWVDRMVMLAIDRHRADWVINADADELWYAPSGSLKTELGLCKKRVMRCRAYCMYPQEGLPFWEWNQRVTSVAEPARYDLSPYSIFQPQRGKVAHRSQGYLHIAMGNHKVAMLPRTVAQGDIVIYHYSVGDRQTFMQKMIQGGRELEKHSGRHGGAHWRYFYKLYQEGRLGEEYDRVVGRNNFDRLVADGHIIADNTIRDFFRTNFPSLSRE